MNERSGAGWAGPVAARLNTDRLEVIAFARSAPADLWDRPSGIVGWTYKDILSHLAGGTDQLLQTILRSVSTGGAVDPVLFQLDTDIENALGVEARRNRTVDDLIDELERDRTEVQILLSQLTDADRDRRWEGFSLNLGEFLDIVAEERHDRIHLAQMRAGLRPAGRNR